MGSVTLLRFVVPQAEPALDGWIFTRTAIFSPTRREVSSPKSFSSPHMSVTDVFGSAGVCEVWVNARVNTRVGEADVRPHDTVFEGFGLVVPLTASFCNTPLHCQDAVVFMH